MRITAIELERLRLPLDPPFCPAWDSVPRRHFDATLVKVRTGIGLACWTASGGRCCRDSGIKVPPMLVTRTGLGDDQAQEATSAQGRTAR
jgi:hypothetical protein